MVRVWVRVRVRVSLTASRVFMELGETHVAERVPASRSRKMTSSMGIRLTDGM